MEIINSKTSEKNKNNGCICSSFNIMGIDVNGYEKCVAYCVNCRKQYEIKDTSTKPRNTIPEVSSDFKLWKENNKDKIIIDNIHRNTIPSRRKGMQFYMAISYIDNIFENN